MQDSGESDHAFGGPSTPAGVLADGDLRRAVGEGWVRSEDAIPEASYQPASLDLRLGPTAHRLRSSFLPSEKRVKERLADYSMGSVDLRRGGILEKNRPYLVPLLEEVRLPPFHLGQGQPAQLHRTAGRLHPGYHGLRATLRRDPNGLRGAALPRSRLAVVHDSGPRGAFAEPAPADPRQREARGRRY